MLTRVNPPHLHRASSDEQVPGAAGEASLPGQRVQDHPEYVLSRAEQFSAQFDRACVGVVGNLSVHNSEVSECYRS